MDLQLDLGLFATALGLALALEGLPYFLFPDKMPGLLRTLASQPPAVLRTIGLVAVCCGLLLVYLVRSAGA